MVKRRAQPQAGNIFFIILLGIILFAAISGAIMQNSGSQNIKSERAALLAQQIMRQANELKQATDRLYQNRISEADIRFAHAKMPSEYGDITDTPTRQVFADEGGGLPLVMIPPAASRLSSADGLWTFFGSSDIPQSGTSAADLVAVAPDIKEAVCRKINEALGYTYTATIPVDDSSDSKCVYSATAADRFAGTFKTGGNINIVGTSGFTILPAYEACVSCSGTYHYYKVLIER